MPQRVEGGRIRALLFDKDGTLLDFRRTWLPAYRGAAAELAAAAGLCAGFPEVLLARHGYDAERDQFDPVSPLVWATSPRVAELFAAEPELAAVSDARARALRHFADHDAYPPVPVTDLAALFERLRGRGLRLGIATMDTAAAAEATLARMALEGRVDFLVAADGGHGLKPEAGMVLAFCAATGVPPGQVAVVGDSLADLAMARAAGAGLAVAVCTGGCAREQLAGQADLVLESIALLEPALEPWL